MKRGFHVSNPKTGRPLSFDRDKSLHQAMLVFWKHGYEATSLSKLTAAMGVTPPSIYAAYGGKKELFREAVSRYLTQPISPIDFIAQAETAYSAACQMVQGAAVAFTGKNTPPGCLLASSAIAVSTDAEDVQRELAEIRLKIERALRRKIEMDVAAGRLPKSTDCATLASFIITLIQGLSTLARDGASRAKLMKIARFALKSWPSPQQ